VAHISLKQALIRKQKNKPAQGKLNPCVSEVMKVMEVMKIIEVTRIKSLLIF